jgi:threonine dehydrogenase-like Zn-dependent dehydrogenase
LTGISKIGGGNTKNEDGRLHRTRAYEKAIPEIGALDALLRILRTTIRGTDIHILEGEYPLAAGLTIGQEPVGVVEKLESAVTGLREGQRVIAGGIMPSGHSSACLCAA